MAKVRATLADVKTHFEPAPPERYRLRIKKVDEKITRADPPNQDKERQAFNVEVYINDGGEHQNKPIYHNISMNKKDGDVNTAGQADLKRLFMAVRGIEEDDEFFKDADNLDTDLLINQEFECDVYIESYDNTKTGGKKGQVNRLDLPTATPLGAGR